MQMLAILLLHMEDHAVSHLRMLRKTTHVLFLARMLAGPSDTVVRGLSCLVWYLICDRGNSSQHSRSCILQICSCPEAVRQLLQAHKSYLA